MGEESQGTSWRGALRAELAGGWSRWASFACIWLWTCLVGKSGVTSGLLAGLPGILGAPTVVVLFATVATLALVVLTVSDDASVVGSRAALAAGGGALVAGSACVVAGVLSGALPAFVVGAGLGGVSIGLLKIAWGEMFSRMGLREGLIDMGLALVASTTVFLVLLPAPRAVQLAALVACALPCAPLLARGVARLADRPVPAPPPGTAHAITFSWTLLILPALFGVTLGLMTGVLQLRDGGTDAAQVGMTLAELAGGLVLLSASALLSSRFGASQIYAVGLVATVAGAALASVQAVPPWVAITVNELGFSVFYFFMVVWWGDLARRVDRPLVRTYATGYLVFQASQIPGLLVGYGLLAAEGQSAALIFLAVVLAFFVVVLLVFNDPHSALRQWLAVGEPAETSDAVPEACAELAAAHALTPREHEVLGLLARGRTAPYVGRALGISPDTAKVHIRNIYRKLDVHTQQELIDLVSARAGG